MPGTYLTFQVMGDTMNQFSIIIKNMAISFSAKYVHVIGSNEGALIYGLLTLMSSQQQFSVGYRKLFFSWREASTQ